MPYSSRIGKHGVGYQPCRILASYAYASGSKQAFKDEGTVLIDLDAEIQNWARLVRVGRIAHFCGSAEKYFRPPAAENLETNESTATVIRPDARRGWACEFAWRQLPSVSVRLLVSNHYVKNRTLEESARKAKIPKHKAEFLLNQARLEMKVRILTSRKV